MSALLNRWTKLTAATIITASGFIAISAAGPTAAWSVPCTVKDGYTLSTNPPGILSQDFVNCLSNQRYYPVSIQQQQADGSWKTVASGTGTAFYQCNGTATHQYQTLGKEFTDACG